MQIFIKIMHKIVALVNGRKSELMLVLVFCAGVVGGSVFTAISTQGKLDQIASVCTNGGWLLDSHGNKYACKFVGK